MRKLFCDIIHSKNLIIKIHLLKYMFHSDFTSLNVLPVILSRSCVS